MIFKGMGIFCDEGTLAARGLTISPSVHDPC